MAAVMAVTAPPGLVPIESRPFNAETPLAALADAPNPTSLFYVRNHFDVPRLDAEEWRLRVKGLVEAPLELLFTDLRRFPERTLTVTLECAGNGRTAMSPVPSGTPWGYGAVGTARFTGTPLREVLERVRVLPEAVELLFLGADRGQVTRGRSAAFGRSLEVGAAQNPDVLLAWAMNGELLTADHGFPVRLVVPGWYGVASVKWLVAISALPAPFDGYYQRDRYVYVGEAGTPDGTPVSFMRVRSVIATPEDGGDLDREPVEVAGTAWSGAGGIALVQVTADGGGTWLEAELGEPASSYAATPWRLLWTPPSAGPYSLAARARDTAGNVQPLESLWNEYGYGNNVVHRVRVRVR